MEISLGLAEALARFAYIQIHRAETSNADQTARPRRWRRTPGERPTELDAAGERVQRYGWHPRIECPQKVEECPRNLKLALPIL